MTDSPTGILRLALPVKLRRLLDYLPPQQATTDQLKPGVRVRVPFGRGNREVIGILIQVKDRSDLPADKLRAATAILDSTPILPETILRLVSWTARYYHHPIGDTLMQALPARLRQGYDLAKEQQLFWHPAQQWEHQAEQALVRARAPKQQEAWELIKGHPDGLSDKALRTMGFDRALLNNLAKRGLATAIERTLEVPLFYEYSPLLKSSPLALNPEQARALDAITAEHHFHTTLLYGVTGSGKTEVYLQAIAQVLNRNQQALVLIPEIGLTPQTLNRFQERFHVPVVALHSGLTDRERLNGWLSARRGEAGIVIATRSGIFTPLHTPGIIIVDEEHDLSYKQQDSVRYSARDLAICRGQFENIPVVLGSATPSMETLHNSNRNRYHCLPLRARAGKAIPPKLTLVDTRQQPLQGGLTPETLVTIRETLNQGQQVLVFLNRRGYAPTLTCDHCGWLIDCPHCDARLTLHRTPLRLHCHHCDHQQSIPRHCPNCHRPELSPVGQGTERTEEILGQLFAGGQGKIDVLRIDRDSTRKKHALQEMVETINRGEPAILVGTQMLAKGHHFPAVTLVVILNADAGLFSADFRGPEKTGQLILQVAGRSGRAEQPGQVVIQTGHPEHPLLQTLIQQGYDSFSQDILHGRQAIGLPPFSHMALIGAEAPPSQSVEQFLQQTAQQANGLLATDNVNGPDGVMLLGPKPAPMEKRQGRLRWQLLLQAKSRKPLHSLLSALLPLMEQNPLTRKVRWSVDVDPQDMG